MSDTVLSDKIFSDKLPEMLKRSEEMFLKLFKGLTALGYQGRRRWAIFRFLS
jgi:hypothetical protein